MKVPIEILVVFILILFSLTCFVFFWLSKKIKLWRYKPENDKGRRAEELRRREFTNIQRSILPERRSTLQNAIINLSRENSNSSGKSTVRFIKRT